MNRLLTKKYGVCVCVPEVSDWSKKISKNVDQHVCILMVCIIECDVKKIASRS